MTLVRNKKIDNRTTDEGKYINLFESLKKNETVKQYVIGTMIRKLR